MPKVHKNDLFPLGPRKVTPGEIWDGHKAKTNHLIEYGYKRKFGAFNPR